MSVPESVEDFNPHPADLTQRTESSPLDKLLDESVVLPFPDEGKSPNGSGTPKVEQNATASHDGGALPQAVRFHPYSLAELIARPSKSWLTRPIYGRGDLGMTFGPPGSCKTFAVIDMIICACLGMPFAGYFNVARPLNIAYCAGEGLDGLPQRFAAAAKHHGVNGNLPNFTFFEIVPQLFDQNSPDSIAIFVNEWKARQEAGQAEPLDLLAIDTQHAATAGADENSSTAMGAVLASAKAAIKGLGSAVLLIHHSNRAGTGERGSSSMRGAMDFMIEFKEEAKGRFTMSCSKLKDGEKWEPQSFSLVDIGLSAPCVSWDGPKGEDGGDGRKSETARNILRVLYNEQGSKLTAMQIGEAIGITPQAVNNVMHRLEKEGLVVRELLKSRGADVWHYSITNAGKIALQDEDTPI